MPKTPKIDVITVKLICHIPVNRSDRESVDAAYDTAHRLCDTAESLGQTTWEKRLNRIRAPKPAPEASEPEPEPTDDGLDIPPHMVRTGTAP